MRPYGFLFAADRGRRGAVVSCVVFEQFQFETLFEKDKTDARTAGSISGEEEIKKKPFAEDCKGLLSCGAPEEIRTPDLQVRSLLLYPAELRAREKTSKRKPSACQQTGAFFCKKFFLWAICQGENGRGRARWPVSEFIQHIMCGFWGRWGSLRGKKPLFAASKRGFFPLKKTVMSPDPTGISVV